MSGQPIFVLLEMMNAMVLVAQEAKRRGFRVVALNRAPLTATGPFAVPPGVVDDLVPIRSWADDAELDAVFDDLAHGGPVVGTYAVFEAVLPHEARLRQRSGLPATPPEVVRAVLDKAQVRSVLRQQGLSRLASVSLDEALSWPAWQFDGAAVLKPANGTGSALCFVVGSMTEIRDAAEQVRAAKVVNPLMRDYILAHGQFLLEEKAEGELLSVESLVLDGEVHVLGLTGRYVLAQDPVVEQGLFFPCHHPQRDAIVAASEAIHRSLGLVHGATHLEVMVDESGGVELIDFNPRFAGFASTVSFGEVFGFPFETVLTDVACGVRPDLGFVDGPTRFAAEMLVMPPQGTTELREVVFPADAVVPRLMKPLGERLTGRSDQLDAVGMFIVSGGSASGVHDRALQARRQVLVNGRPIEADPATAVTFSRFIGRDLPPGAPAAAHLPTTTRGTT
jgi:hypothetical protein